jgi:pimeloyl-ACP methyl ester carboxylesterase
MLRLLLLGIGFLPALLLAQSFPIGNRSITFNDPARNRAIPVDIYYPGSSSGDNVPLADGAFPVLIMGHGFVMTVDAYMNLRDHFVPRGYILVLPTTEGGLSPSHAAFGQDLAFLVGAMQAENTSGSSPFFEHVAPATALMGHSMGGGASFLGAANNYAIQALVNFAAAETDPSAIAAAAAVTVPTLVFAGSVDCITPIPQHQGPMYAATAASCKAFVNIQGGGHCHFANNNFNCSFGELTCGSATISRAAQHAVVNDFAGLWLDHFLKGDANAFTNFSDSVAGSSRVIAELNCISTGLDASISNGAVRVFPVPTKGELNVVGISGPATVQVLDLAGRVMMNERRWESDGRLLLEDLPAGRYHLFIKGVERVTTVPFVVVR